jgi:hypothetical protein
MDHTGRLPAAGQKKPASEKIRKAVLPFQEVQRFILPDEIRRRRQLPLWQNSGAAPLDTA